MSLSDVDPNVLDDDDLFDLADSEVEVWPGERGISRDRWDRPLIKPPAGGWPDGKVARWQTRDDLRPYRRISNLAKGIDPAYGLAIWKLRHALLSVARRPDLQALLCGLMYSDGAAIDEIVDEALIRAKDDDTDPDLKLQAAHWGTALHAFTTPGRPKAPKHLSDLYLSTSAFHAAMEDKGLELVDSERFVVNDDLECAGTYDHLVRCPDGAVRVLDKKTGALRMVSHICQLNGYASGQHYDPANGQRTPLHPDLDPDTGLVVHVNVKSGEVEVRPIKLHTGLATLAVAVHTANSADYLKDLVGRPL